jgi:hypothetical protein
MKESWMKVLFLDVDGVLNRWGSGQPFDEELVDELSRVVRISGAAVCVSSTWRKLEAHRERLLGVLTRIGAPVVGWTPDLGSAGEDGNLYIERGDEIQAWLDGHPEVSEFVILDDNDDMAHLLHRLVLTDGYTGLTRDKGDEVIAMFSN